MGIGNRRLLALVLDVLSAAKYRIGLLHTFISGKIPVPHTFSFGIGDSGIPFVVDSSGAEVFLSSIDRASMYRRGLKYRLNELVDQYGLSEILAREVKTFVDVGANIGEFGIALSGIPSVTYVAFEPDPVAFSALCRNASSGVLVNKAVSDYVGESVLYLATDTADSSLILPSVAHSDEVRIPVTTLDVALKEVGILEISVLKVEAEGGEAEVLRGARETLRRTSFCVVDAGPERFGKSTAPDCIRILHGAGFELLDVRFPRGIFVFVNSQHNVSSEP